MTYKGNSYKNMVVSANRKIHLSIEEAILHKDNSIEMIRRDVQLNCLASKGECITQQGTFLWEKPTLLQQCPLFQARVRVTGILIKNELNVETFISTDGSMIRMVLTGQLKVCNSTI